MTFIVGSTMQNNLNLLHHQSNSHLQNNAGHMNDEEANGADSSNNIFWDKTISSPAEYHGFSSTIGIPITPSVILSDCFYDYSKQASTQSKFARLNLNILAREIRNDNNNEICETQFFKYCKPIIEQYIPQELTALRLKYRLETLQKYVRFNTMISWISAGRTDIDPEKLFPKRLRKIFEDGDENGNRFTPSQMLVLIEEHNNKGKDYRTFKKRINNQDLTRFEDAMDEFALRAESVEDTMVTSMPSTNSSNQYSHSLNQSITPASTLNSYTPQLNTAISEPQSTYINTPMPQQRIRRPIETPPSNVPAATRKRHQIGPVSADVESFIQGVNKAVNSLSSITQQVKSKEYKITEILTTLLKKNLINTSAYLWISQELIEFGEFPTSYSVSAKYIDGLIAVYDVSSSHGTLQNDSTIELFMLHLRRKFSGII
ncbi:hypothetical protein WICPIJ_003321 [Wickerhamomyces pijperi]|uniref:Uncharacterized protein n=1 Tax=Wickerhamomyces pijperi TaxID=599730 RepID=A0A9P8Q859_WICPI|nr:hypothetical protein WICPIJ_003321 [Wickerhamomyces pijperi]